MKEVVELDSPNSEDRVILGKPPLPNPIPGFDRFGHIDLKGQGNTRDLGGMPAADGRRIQPHRLIRGGALHELKDSDIKILLDQYDLKRIFDFRADFEREASPDPLEKMPGVTAYASAPFESAAVGITRNTNLLRDFDMIQEMMEKPFERVRDLYAITFASKEGIASYRKFLHVLLEADEGATLWHCTEGKDRAGAASYLVEAALGVPDTYRRADYIATNLFVRSQADKWVDAMARYGIARKAAEELDALFYAFPAYLDNGLHKVDEEFGSLDAYLAEALDFGPEKQAALREKYLEPQ